MSEQTHLLVDVGFLAAKAIMIALAAEGLKPVQAQARPPHDALLITTSSGTTYTVFRDGKIVVHSPEASKAKNGVQKTIF